MSITKKKKGIVAVLLTIALVLTFLSPLTAYAADESILDAPNASVPATGEKVDAKYEFIAKYIENATSVSYFGSGWTTRYAQNKTDNTVFDYPVNAIKPTDSQKGNIGVLYTNVGTYQGVTLDLKLTILDWEQYTTEQQYINYGQLGIEHWQQGYNWVEQKWQFLESGTNNPVEVSGYYTFNDLDWLQYFQFDATTSSKIDKIYASSDTWIKYSNENGEYKFYSSTYEGSNDYDDKAMFTFLYSDCSEIVFKWGKDYAKSGMSPSYNFITASGFELYGDGEYFGYLAKKPLATETAVPTKTVSDSDETDVNNNSLDAISEAFTYSIYHSVPDEWEDFYYSSYVFTDTICEILDISSVKIYDDGDNDVTSKFDIDITNNLVTASAKTSFLSSADFYYNNYRFDIQVQIKDGADLSSYLTGSTDKAATYQFPNQASITIDGDSAVSNKVTTKYIEVIPDEPVLPGIEKSIVDGESLVGSLTIERENREITFQSSFDVTNQVDLQSVVIEDELEAPFTYKSLFVYDSDGIDVTSWGDIAVSGQTVTFTFKSAYFDSIKGKSFTLKLTVDYDSTYDLIEYVYGEIPNTISIITNGDYTNSNTVTVIPKVNSEVEKKIKNEDELLDELKIKYENQSITYYGKATFTNQDNLTSAVISDALESPFTYQSLKVYNSKGADVTSHGNINVDGQMVTFTFNDSYLDKVAGQTFTLELVVTYDSSADLSDYVYAEIPNELTITANSNPTTSNTVIVQPDVPAVSEKKIVNGEELLDYLSIEYKDQNITYYGSVTFPNNEELTSAVIQDVLEAPLAYQSLKVYNNKGEDITSNGTINVDGQTITFTFNNSYLDNVAGQTFTLELVVEYDSSADLNGYINAEIPNELTIIANGNPTTSTEVNVKPDVPTVVEKKIVTKDGLVENLNIENVDQVITFYGSASISNKETLKSVVISDTLEDALSYVDGSFVVYDSYGNDITDKGTVSVEGQTVTFTFDKEYLIYLAGHNISWELQAQYDASTDLSAYDNNTIPNLMDLIINGEVTTSNEVTVVVKENVGTVVYSYDDANNIDNTSAQTGDYNILLIVLAAAVALSLIIIVRIKQKSKKTNK